MTIDEQFARDVVRMRQELDAMREQRDRLLRAYGTRTIVPEAHLIDKMEDARLRRVEARKRRRVAP